MKVYVPTERERATSHAIYVTPGTDPETIKEGVPSEWLDQEGKAINFRIEFKQGVANVDDKIGAYMLKRGLARKTSLIRPGDIHHA